MASQQSSLGPLSGRTWAWQEWSLSTRTIVCTPQPILWECRSEERPESISYSGHDHAFRGRQTSCHEQSRGDRPSAPRVWTSGKRMGRENPRCIISFWSTSIKRGTRLPGTSVAPFRSRASVRGDTMSSSATHTCGPTSSSEPVRSDLIASYVFLVEARCVLAERNPFREVVDGATVLTGPLSPVCLARSTLRRLETTCDHLQASRRFYLVEKSPGTLSLRKEEMPQRARARNAPFGARETEYPRVRRSTWFDPRDPARTRCAGYDSADHRAWTETCDLRTGSWIA